MPIYIFSYNPEPNWANITFITVMALCRCIGLKVVCHISVIINICLNESLRQVSSELTI